MGEKLWGALHTTFVARETINMVSIVHGPNELTANRLATCFAILSSFACGVTLERWQRIWLWLTTWACRKTAMWWRVTRHLNLTVSGRRWMRWMQCISHWRVWRHKQSLSGNFQVWGFWRRSRRHLRAAQPYIHLQRGVLRRSPRHLWFGCNGLAQIQRLILQGCDERIRHVATHGVIWRSVIAKGGFSTRIRQWLEHIRNISRPGWRDGNRMSVFGRHTQIIALELRRVWVQGKRRN